MWLATIMTEWNHFLFIYIHDFIEICFQILHTSGQIEILCDILRNISSKMNNQQLIFCMKEAIGKHQKIITFSDKIDKIFSYIALIQFMSSTLLTCCIGFTVITVILCQK